MQDALSDVAERVWAAFVRTHEYRLQLRRRTANCVNASRAVIRDSRQLLIESRQNLNDKSNVQPSFLVGQNATLRAQIMRLEEQLAANQQMLAKDDLLPCASRRTLGPLLEHEVARARRDGTSLAVAMVDIDHFKAINDKHGHDAGDAALIHFSRLMRGWLRNADVCVRYGGDEFVMVLPGTNLQGASEVACKLMDQLALSPLHYRGKLLNLSVSVGLSELVAEEAWRALLQRADRGLYAAKAAGRGCTRIAT